MATSIWKPWNSTSIMPMINRCQQNTDPCFHVVRLIEQEVHAYHEGNLDRFSVEKFVEIWIVDSCFMLELLLGFEWRFEQLRCRENGHVFSNNEYMQFSIMRDMIRLENQIMLFILKTLYRRNNLSGKSIVELLLNLWHCCMVSCSLILLRCKFFERQISEGIIDPSLGFKHCLNIFKQTLTDTKGLHPMLFPPVHVSLMATLELSTPSAIQLNDLTIKFKMGRTKVPVWCILF